MSRLITVACCALVATVGITTRVCGQTYTWTGAAFSGQMSTPANWAGNMAPISGDPNLKLVFSGFNNAFQDIATPLVLQDLEFSSGFFTTSGGALQFDNLGANPTITSTGNNTIANAIDFADPTTISLTNTQLDLGGVLSGSSSLTFNGSGSALVGINAAGNSYSGTATINPGVQVHLNNASVLGGTVNVAGGILQPQASGALAAGTDLNVSNGGQVFLSAQMTVDDLDVSTGAVFLFNNLSVTGAISSSSGSNAIGQSSGALSMGNNTSINVTSGGTDHLNINAVIAAGSFTKTGTGKLVLGAFSPSTFSGTNTVSAGTLRGSAAAIGTVVNNATLELTGGTLTTPQISGPGNVIITGGGVQYDVAQSYTGTTTIDGGSLSGFVTTLPALITGVGAGGGIVFNDTTNATNTSTIAGNLSVFKSTSGVLTMGGNSPYTGGTSIFGGGLAIASDTAIGSGPLSLFTSGQTLEAIGSRTLSNPLQIGSGVTVQGAGDFNFTDATSKVLNGQILHNSTGTTTIAGKVDVAAGGNLTVAAGSLALGDATIVNGFTSTGPVTVNGGTLTLNSLNFINLPTVTLAGGTLNVPNGYAIPLGAVLQGAGGVTGRLATANGSTTIASGNLTLGDSAHPAGVNFDGELYTNNNTVTLQDSNQAVLGSITDIGTATLDGTLVAPNGAVLNFGRNIVGRGQVQSNNALADAVIVNGDVNGDSTAAPLVFSGYVKGVGTFNNVAFSGTFAPGLSPTLMTVGNTILLPTNVLEMELGGLNRGGQYDAFDVTPASTMVLDGAMQVSLINGFNPAAGNQFDLFNGTTTGTFDSMFLPPLNVGLVWDASQLYSNGILQVLAIPEPATLSMAAAVCGLVMRRRRA